MSESKYIKLYRGDTFFPMEEIYRSEKYKNGKIIIFDLDETLGSFSDLYILWKTLEKHLTNVNKMDTFSKVFDLCPEFLRHGILNILEFLYYKKQNGECSKIFIYTNNQCSGKISLEWVPSIIQCIESKIVNKGSSIPLFDEIVENLKIGAKNIDLKRVTNEKTYLDFIKFTLLPKTTELCFIDNSFFPKMCGGNIYYIQPRSYYHYLKPNEIIHRFIISDVFQQLNYNGSWFETLLYESFLEKRPFINVLLLEKRLETDLLISQKLMYYIREFFYLYSRKIKTRKVRKKLGRFTIKKRK